MKKIKDKSKYLKFQRRALRARLIRIRLNNRLRSHTNRNRQKARFKVKVPRGSFLEDRMQQFDEIVVAPTNLSFNKNTEQVVGLIEAIEKLYNAKKTVFVDLRKVREIDYGAIVVILSIIVKFKSSQIRFDGSFPQDLKARQKLITSGFFDNLSKSFEEEDQYELSGKNTDKILTHARKMVDSPLGARLIQAAAITIWGEERRCQGVQRVLVELMQNTNNHAEIGKPGEKHWWLYVNHLPIERRVCFAFVDFGVGVFKSLEQKPNNTKWADWKTKILKVLQYEHNADLLKSILSGQFHKTVTGEYYRGKGLPGIAAAHERNQISALQIVTNDVRCSFATAAFYKMNKSFNGTYIYWEIGESNVNCK